MNYKHKVYILSRGRYFQFFIDVTIEECHRREEKRIAEMCKMERDHELKHELVITEIDFDDYFGVWMDAGKDINEMVNAMFQKLD